MINSKKKGFTIIELVIVIAVIAVLAAVLIPTFSSLIKKANMSADQQAVTQMNKALAVAEADTEINTPKLMYAALEESGYNGKDYKPLATDMYFFWAKKVNRIVYVDKDNKVVFPINLGEDANYFEGNWWSLSGDISEAEAPEINAGVATVSSAGQLVALAEDFKKSGDSDLTEVKLSGNIDFMGAAVTFGALKTGQSLVISGTSASNPAVLMNIRTEDTTYSDADSNYNTGIIGYVPYVYGSDVNIKFENLIIDGAFVGDAEDPTINVGILIGQVYHLEAAALSVEINNVIIKNSTIIGNKKVGTLIGRTRGESTVTIKDVNISNTKVYANSEAAKLIGFAMSSGQSPTTIKIEGSNDFNGIEVNPLSSATQYIKHGDVTWNGNAPDNSANTTYYVNSNNALCNGLTDALAWTYVDGEGTPSGYVHNNHGYSTKK